MKTIGALLGLLLLVSILGCQTQRVLYPDVDYDFNTTTDFSDIKTYTWRRTSGGVKINHFELATPTLTEIFLMNVGEENE